MAPRKRRSAGHDDSSWFAFGVGIDDVKKVRECHNSSKLSYEEAGSPYAVDCESQKNGNRCKPLAHPAPRDRADQGFLTAPFALNLIPSYWSQNGGI